MERYVSATVRICDCISRRRRLTVFLEMGLEMEQLVSATDTFCIM